MVAIIDYGVGNLFSLNSSLKAIGIPSIVTGKRDDILNADRLILPGVGAFGDAAEKLFDTGLGELIISEAGKGKPLLGICLGMQLLFDKSYEFGEYKGLGLIPGEVIPMRGVIPDDLKIPHIGWNSLIVKNENGLFTMADQGRFVYFVHSFYAECDDRYISASAGYGCELTAAVSNKNVFGCQFHPEKSGDFGLEILRRFCSKEQET